jgi:hypothetical protein
MGLSRQGQFFARVKMRGGGLVLQEIVLERARARMIGPD